MAERNAPIGEGGFQPELVQDFGRRTRIDRKPRPHRCARGVVNLVDQPGSQLDKLPFFVAAMRTGLNVEIGQNAQQRRADIDALAPGQRHQPVEAGK